MLDNIETNDIYFSYIYLFIAVIVNSFNALFILLCSNLSDWTIIFYRYLIIGLFIFIYFIINSHTKTLLNFYNIGFIGFIAGIVYGLSGIVFVFAVNYDSIGSLYIISSTAPLFASFFSYFLMNETISIATLITLILCIIIIIILVCVELMIDSASIFGICMSIANVVFTTLYLVLARYINYNKKKSDKLDLTPILIIGSFLSVFISLFFEIDYISLTNYNIMYLIIQGIFVVAIPNIIFVYVTNVISVVTISLIRLSNIILSPMWIWICGLEEVSYDVVYIGIVIFVILLINGLIAIYENNDNQLINDKVEETKNDLIDESNNDLLNESTRLIPRYTL